MKTEITITPGPIRRPSGRHGSAAARVTSRAISVACTLWLLSGASAETVRIRVAGAQIPVAREVAKNVEAITRAIDYAAREKADILVTPEGSLSGYTPEFDAEATRRGLDTVLSRARAAGLALVLGTCFQAEDRRRYDAQQFYDKDGRYLGFHAKILLCRQMAKPEVKAEIDCFQTVPLRIFNFLGLTIGGLVCNDMWAQPEWTPMDDPHLSQRLKEMGARVIFVSANTGRSTGDNFALSRSYHDANLRLRARSGKLWIVVVNAAEATGEKGLHCASGVVAPNGTWALTVSSHREHFFVHTIEMDAGAPTRVGP